MIISNYLFFCRTLIVLGTVGLAGIEPGVRTDEVNQGLHLHLGLLLLRCDGGNLHYLILNIHLLVGLGLLILCVTTDNHYLIPDLQTHLSSLS